MEKMNLLGYRDRQSLGCKSELRAQGREGRSRQAVQTLSRVTAFHGLFVLGWQKRAEHCVMDGAYGCGKRCSALQSQHCVLRAGYIQLGTLTNQSFTKQNVLGKSCAKNYVNCICILRNTQLKEVAFCGLDSTHSF